MKDDFYDFSKMTRLIELRQAAFEGTGGLAESTFDRDNGQVSQLSKVRQYADHWDQMNEKGLGLLLWGMPGSGKTFAAACIANALMERGASVRMVTLGQVLNRLPTLSPEEKLVYLDKLKACDLLILDDFGMERKTDYAREQIFSIVDGRYLSRKPMVITTNLVPAQMKSPADLAACRVFDRILEVCIPLAFNSGSLRQLKAADNMKLYQALTEQGVVQKTIR